MRIVDRVRTRAVALLAIVAVLFAGVPQSEAASTKLVLLSSAAQTATANGAAFTVPSLTELAVFVDVTAVSGTTPTMSIWLQSSSDGGTTWFDLPFDARLSDNNASATEGAGGAAVPSKSQGATNVDTAVGGRNLNGTTALTGVSKCMGKYTVFSDQIRVRWVIAGTTPSFTFSVRAVGK